jgi:hypothetical protein
MAARLPRTIDGVLPLLVLIVGLGLLVAGWVVLRSFGPRLRVGRLLAATPAATVAEAVALAESGKRRYVAVRGRVDSDREFEDPDHRPLVLRRTRLQVREGRGWRTWEDNREVVPFEIRDGLVGVAVDADALDQGLVVVPRESAGVAGDLGDRAPAGVAADAPVRLRIEQVSSVEHALVLGVPVTAEGGARLTAGLGRPLVLTTLERQEAMRVLAEGRTGAPRAAAVLLGAGVAVSVLGLLWLLVDAVL